jgi:predicted signal transduction protein with EAL and GGDEF domain
VLKIRFSDQPSVALVAEKIREALSQPYILKAHEYPSSPSIGISLFHGNDEPHEILLEHADMAMYQAKKSGRNAVRFLNPSCSQMVRLMMHRIMTGITRDFPLLCRHVPNDFRRIEVPLGSGQFTYLK